MFVYHIQHVYHSLLIMSFLLYHISVRVSYHIGHTPYHISHIQWCLVPYWPYPLSYITSPMMSRTILAIPPITYHISNDVSYHIGHIPYHISHLQWCLIPYWPYTPIIYHISYHFSYHIGPTPIIYHISYHASYHIGPTPIIYHISYHASYHIGHTRYPVYIEYISMWNINCHILGLMFVHL